MPSRRFQTQGGYRPKGPMAKKPDPVPFARRCPSGGYEVFLEGLPIATGFDTFDEASDWIKENYK